MIDEREIVRRAAEGLTPPEPSFDRLLHRRDRVQRNRRIRAGVLGLAVAIAVGWLGINAIRSTPPVPAVPPDEPPAELGIFESVAGRILYDNDGFDHANDAGLWAVDPKSPSVSTLVRLNVEEGSPIGWSSDGTELLLSRDDLDTPYPYRDELSILHADGSETQLNTDSRYLEGAAIAPDGSRVVFAAAGGPYFPYNQVHADPGLFVVDTDGGRPVPIPYIYAGDPVSSPTFSPDGTQIAYLVTGLGNGRVHVWVADADGGNAHEILADEPAVAEDVSGLAWSPSGDRIAMDGSLNHHEAIYTSAPDGSEFTMVIDGGMSPSWSPDGSQIAYVLPYGGPRGRTHGLAIANADGSNVREFGFGASGPWHPRAGGGDAG